MSRPPTGSMIYWRYKKDVPGPWQFGFTTYLSDSTLMRMGNFNGDTAGGNIVSVDEIEWKEYSR